MLNGIIKNNTNIPKNLRLVFQDNKKSQAANLFIESFDVFF
jgi:hypothetical protein